MKKILVVLICVFAVLSLFSCDNGGDNGDSNIVAIVESVQSAEEGDIITFSLVLDRSVKAKSGGVEVIYDFDVFELVVPEWMVGNALLKHYDSDKDLGAFLFEEEQMLEGQVFFIKLRVIDGAHKGPSRVQCNLKLQDAQNNSIEIENRSAVVEIK